MAFDPMDGDDRRLYRWEDGEWYANRYPDHVTEQLVRREIQRCRDLKYFAFTYCRTVNERDPTTVTGRTESSRAPTIEPIPRWPYIEAVLGGLDPPQDLVIEKSRDCLMSWLTMVAALHDIVMRPEWPVMTLSYLEKLVDDGGESSTRGSLHGKIRFMYEHLPGFLQAFAPLSFRYLRVLNERNNSHVTGFAATPRAGRGPKWKRAVLDELAFVAHSQQVMFAVVPACPVGKVVVSTPHGKSNAFWEIKERAVSLYPTDDAPGRGGWRRMTVHWTQHPEHDREWYNRKRENMTSEGIAQELDLNYTRALGGRVYSAFIPEKHIAGGSLAHKVLVEYDPARPLIVTCDWNYDPLIWVILQHHSVAPHYRVIDEICRRGAWVADGERELIVRYGSANARDALVADNPDWLDEYGRGGIGVAGPAGVRDVIIYGDATAESNSVRDPVKTYAGMKKMLTEVGCFRVTMKVPPGNPPILSRIELVNHTLSEDDILILPKAEQLLKDFEGGVWNTSQTDVNQNTEDDDGSHLTRSHASSAFGYFLYAVAGRGGIKGRKGQGKMKMVVDYSPDFLKNW